MVERWSSRLELISRMVTRWSLRPELIFPRWSVRWTLGVQLISQMVITHGRQPVSVIHAVIHGFWIPGPLVSIFEISSKNDAERWGRELWSMSLARVPDPFNFYVSPDILVVSSQPPPGPLGRREHPPSAPGSFSCSIEWVGGGGGMEEMKSLSTRGGQRHLRKKFQIF